MAEQQGEFLLEIGCEEIPAGWLPAVTAELRDRFTEQAAAEHLKSENVEAHSTPRRLVVRADVLARQPDREERVWGPRFTASKDKDGNWTAAARGFAQKNRIEVDQLQFAPKLADVGAGDAPFAYTLKKVPGRPSIEVLPGVIAAVLRALSFPKRMSWDAWLDDGKGAFPFGRPIRWLVALLDGVVVPIQIYELVDDSKGGIVVRSGETTHGHRFFPRGKGGEAVRVGSFEELKAKLKERFVLLSREERRQEIRRGLQAVEREIVSDHGLFEDWADLVEHPAVVIGQIPAEFQSLPREVVQTVLIHHQKYIPVAADGRTVSRFAAITDTDGGNSAAIVRGMERVVVARLRDATFFFREDLKRSMEDRLADLEGITFHRKLGSYKDKTRRIESLVYGLGSRPNLLTLSERRAADIAAKYCKADLTTLMVREFTELQGVMGAIYLRAEASTVSAEMDAVRWHYYPVSVEEDSAPAGQLVGDAVKAFAAVSVADKLDTLAGYLGIGEHPSGSRDPYGLRRAAQGVIRVLIDFWQTDQPEARPNLAILIRDAVSGYGPLFSDRFDSLVGGLLLFFHERLKYFLEVRGFAPDEIAAGIEPNPWLSPLFSTQEEKDRAHPVADPYGCYLRVRALHRVRATSPEHFERLGVAFKRARNILEDSQPPPKLVDVSLLTEPAEWELHSAVEELRRSESTWDGDLEGRLRELAILREPVDHFFEQVLVMAEDHKVRANRLALLASALSLFYRIADISKLGG